MANRYYNHEGKRLTLFTEKERWKHLESLLIGHYKRMDPHFAIELMTEDELKYFVHRMYSRKCNNYVQELRNAPSNVAVNRLEEKIQRSGCANEREYFNLLVSEEFNRIFSSKYPDTELIESILGPDYEDFEVTLKGILPTINVEEKTEKWINYFQTIAEIISDDETTEVEVTINGKDYYGYLIN